MFCHQCGDKLSNGCLYCENCGAKRKQPTQSNLNTQGASPQPAIKPFCVYCGNKIEQGSIFCGNCGAKLDSGTPNINASITPNVPVHNYEYSATYAENSAKTLWRYPQDSKMPSIAGGLFIAAPVALLLRHFLSFVFGWPSLSSIFIITLRSFFTLLPIILFSFIWAKRDPKLISLSIGLFVFFDFVSAFLLGSMAILILLRVLPIVIIGVCFTLCLRNKLSGKALQGVVLAAALFYLITDFAVITFIFAPRGMHLSVIFYIHTYIYFLLIFGGFFVLAKGLSDNPGLRYYTPKLKQNIAPQPVTYISNDGVVHRPIIQDAPSFGFAVLSFFFPIVGLILYLVWHDKLPYRARSAGKGALVGVITSVVLTISTIIFLQMLF